jgi:diguanylate cyclase (GGDEF)-like protein/PAS domain S-box-containing protein
VSGGLAKVAGQHNWLFDGSPVAKYVCDVEGRVLEVNLALCRLLGVPPREIVGRTMASFSADPPLRASEVEAFLDGHARTFCSIRRYREASGRVLRARVTLGAVRCPDGTAGTILAEVEDLTAQDLATTELDRRLELALETARMMTWEVRLGPQPSFSAIRADILGLHVTGPVPVTGLLGSPIFGERLFPADREATSQAVRQDLGASGEVLDVEYRWSDDDGQVRWLHTRARADRDPSGRPQRFTGTTADVTAARMEVAARLRAERVLSRTLQASQDAFIGVDREGTVTDWNAAAEAMFGWFRDEIVGEVLAERIGRPDHGALEKILAVLNRPGPGEDGSGVRKELEVFTRGGRHFPAEISAVRLEDDGAPIYRLFVRDLSERKAYESQLIRDALFDPLTGLPNRALLMDRLSGALRRLGRVQGLLAVLFIDVDRFKHVNDGIGHRGGDDFLVELARRIRSVLRPSDTVARFGADEFVVLCEALEAEREAMALAVRVEGVFSTPFALAGVPGREIYASVSVGIALASDVATSAEALVRDAGTAMHRAKEQGGGHVEVFDAEIRRRSIAHLETESELRRALEHSELCVYYQPVVDLSGHLGKVEALVRWARPSGRVALPDEFVPLAEETGLIVPLGESVLQMACEQVSRWRSEHAQLAGLGVAVNVSTAQLRSNDAVDRMAAIIERAGLAPGALVLEITESVLMDEKIDAAKKLAALRSLGVRLAVDDFGTGYSSLLYLRRYPLDMLKIDRSFVAGLVDNAEDATIVDAVVRLGHSFGLQTVAEGVETTEQVRLLQALGCDMGQGHFWGEPLPPGTLLPRLLAGSAAQSMPDIVVPRGPVTGPVGRTGKVGQ